MQEFALVEAICRQACPGQQKQLRGKLQAHDDTNGGGVVVRQLREHEPILGNALHPCPDVGHQGARCPHPIVETTQGTESARHRVLHQLSGVLPP